MLVQILLVVIAFFVGLFIRLARAIAYEGGVPRIGKRGVIGYIQTALRWTLDAESVIMEGRKQFKNGPFVIPMLSGNVFFLPPRYLDRVRLSTDSVFDQVTAVNDDFQLKYTMDEFQLQIPYQAKVMRVDATRAIPAFLPDIQDESTLAINGALDPRNGKDSISLPVFDTMTHLIARISNRVILGKELCRDQGFVHAVVAFAETLMPIARLVQWTPVLLRPFVYLVLSSMFGGKRGALKYVLPHLKQYVKDRQGMEEKPALVMEYLLQNAPDDEPIEITAVRLLNLNFGSIHTSSVFLTQALFEVALLPKKDVDGIRTEVEEALESEGGWTRAALDKFYKLDSALREVGRLYPLMHGALPRVAVLGCELEDGMYVPPGQRVAVDINAIHLDPEIYPDPLRCDVFRFAKLRSDDPSDSKYAFSTVDATYLPFGAGRHACAGRWFASMELKVMLAHILLEYNVSYPPGITTRPKNVVFNGTTVPDPKGHLVFKRRSMKKPD